MLVVVVRCGLRLPCFSLAPSLTDDDDEIKRQDSERKKERAERPGCDPAKFEAAAACARGHTCRDDGRERPGCRSCEFKQLGGGDLPLTAHGYSQHRGFSVALS